MGRSMLIVVCDDQYQVEKAKGFAQTSGLEIMTFSSSEWSRGLGDHEFRGQLTSDLPILMGGVNNPQTGAKILQFPQPVPVETEANKRVRTINELENLAIENAINEYNGNLTEAARALGIGRATLYRKVKQFNIDPSMARRKKLPTAA